MERPVRTLREPCGPATLGQEEREMLFGVARVAILVGGNAVCSKGESAPRSTPDPTLTQIVRLVKDLKDRGVPAVCVLGIPKKRCQRTPARENNQEHQETGHPCRKPANQGTTSIAEVNDLLRQNGDEHGYTFVGWALSSHQPGRLPKMASTELEWIILAGEDPEEVSMKGPPVMWGRGSFTLSHIAGKVRI